MKSFKKRFILPARTAVLCAVLCAACLSPVMGFAESPETVQTAKDIGDPDGLQVIVRKNPKYTINCSGKVSVPTSEYEAAKALSNISGEMCGGLSFRVSSSSQEKEIVVGTDSPSEIAGKFTVDRSALRGDDFLIRTIGDRIIITGITGNGTWNGVEYFVKEYMGFDARSTLEPDLLANLYVPKEIDYIGRVEKTSSELPEIVSDGVFAETGFGDVGYEKLFTHNAYADSIKKVPCYSDQRVTDKLSAKAATAGKLIFNNSSPVCSCEACTAAAAETGSPMGAYFLAVKEAASANPDNQIRILAMNGTYTAPDVALGDNVEVLICNRRLCSAHAVNDPDCPVNAEFCANLSAWKKLCGRVSVVDFTSDYAYFPVTFPTFYTMKKNVEWYSSQELYAVYLQFGTKQSDLEFSDLRTFLAESLLASPGMSDDEYSALIDTALRCLYGESAEPMRRYIDSFTVNASKAGCFDVYSKPDEIVGIKKYDGIGMEKYNLDFARSAYLLWDEASPYNETLAKGTSGYSRMLNARIMSLPAAHARLQFSEWLAAVTDIHDRTQVINAVTAK